MKEMLYHLKSLSEERAPATTHGWGATGRQLWKGRGCPAAPERGTNQDIKNTLLDLIFFFFFLIILIFASWF